VIGLGRKISGMKLVLATCLVPLCLTSCGTDPAADKHSHQSYVPVRPSDGTALDDAREMREGKAQRRIIETEDAAMYRADYEKTVAAQGDVDLWTDLTLLAAALFVGASILHFGWRIVQRMRRRTNKAHNPVSF